MKIALAIGRGTDTIWRKEHLIASVAHPDRTEAGMFLVNEEQIEMRELRFDMCEGCGFLQAALPGQAEGVLRSDCRRFGFYKLPVRELTTA